MAWKNHQNHVVVVLLTVFVFLSVELLAFYTGFLFPHLLCGEQQHGHAAVLQGQQEGSRLRLVKNAVKPEATTTTSKIGSIINSASPNQRTIKNQYGAGSRRSGNNCQSLDNAARQMNASENSRLGCLLRRHAEKWMNKHIILGTVSVTSVEYVEMTKAWLHSIKDAGDDANVLLVGMTPGTCELLLRHNVPYCVPVEWIGLSEQQVVTTPLVIERGYTTSGKRIIILAILEAGYDVVFLDMDIHVRNSLFNSSVFDWDQDSYDLRTQTDLIPSNRESFFESTYIFEGKYKCGMGFKDPDWQKSLWLDKRNACANTGLMFWKATPSSRLMLSYYVTRQLGFVRDAANEHLKAGTWEQSSFNLALQAFAIPSGSFRCFSQFRWHSLPIHRFTNLFGHPGSLLSSSTLHAGPYGSKFEQLAKFGGWGSSMYNSTGFRGMVVEESCEARMHETFAATLLSASAKKFAYFVDAEDIDKRSNAYEACFNGDC
jgi:hypothetical protein